MISLQDPTIDGAYSTTVRYTPLKSRLSSSVVWIFVVCVVSNTFTSYVLYCNLSTPDQLVKFTDIDSSITQLRQSDHCTPQIIHEKHLRDFMSGCTKRKAALLKIVRDLKAYRQSTNPSNDALVSSWAKVKSSFMLMSSNGSRNEAANFNWRNEKDHGTSCPSIDPVFNHRDGTVTIIMPGNYFVFSEATFVNDSPGQPHGVYRHYVEKLDGTNRPTARIMENSYQFPETIKGQKTSHQEGVFQLERGTKLRAKVSGISNHIQFGLFML